ncbi:hypothetical protein LOTGIDRAFT_160309 [Lottia gigantea]|uniref:Fibronectin type-III domain-containing protein n=1 Tax=Lottia gigantea TaxID=225164 RepID=V4AFT4_LOTGI|nr:hypothetical protein LOTGIDRAFT_160309 [Lottia gigantea]ESO95762.1 hypothetical protein LOTGIDRAFT_160309 [Lottia gigantea]
MSIRDVLPPKNLTVVAIGTTRARLIWIYIGSKSKVRRFEVTYEWLLAPTGKYSVTYGIDVYSRQVTLKGLIPFQSYQVFMVSIDREGTTTNTSNLVEFTTRGEMNNESFVLMVLRDYNVDKNVQSKDGFQAKYNRFIVTLLYANQSQYFVKADDRAYVPIKHTLHIEEVIIISLIVIFWFVTVVVFWRRWDSIRILQPMEPRFKHNPKNLDTIKVVKRAQDSVIYKTYSRKLSLTMVAREKHRLQRMHTAPVLPTIHMEDVTTEM